MSSWINRLDRAIVFCFYAIFFLVPLVMFPTTFELFEFNKMWIVFGFALLILFFWISKIIISQELVFRRTPLDMPILLFLLSQIISTLFSMDPHVSFWGYYSRFNGGLLSTLTYIFLYYALASNLIADQTDSNKKPISYKLLLVSLISGTIVALWGFPSHFGYDPTCLVFRGKLDVSCWTFSFQPMVRIFSTLGQPNWLAVYLSILIPISIAFTLKNQEHEAQNSNLKLSDLFRVSNFGFLILSILFYIDLLWARSQSGFLALWAGIIFIGILFKFLILKESNFQIIKLFHSKILYVFAGIICIFLLFTFFIGTPIGQLNRFTWSEIKPKANQTTQSSPKPSKEQPPTVSAGELGGTDSSKIRLIVWRGALEIFSRHPFLGTGPETFAFAYYQVKPKEHNLTSEWDYLYNKAHNEFLNYAATSGAFGIGSYLLLIGWFLFTALKHLLFNIYLTSKKNDGSSIIDNRYAILGAALIGSYIALHVSNFFGFSVVIVNLFFFLIPLFFYELVAPHAFHAKHFTFSDIKTNKEGVLTAPKMMILVIAGLVILYLELLLFRFWQADKHYSLGYNLDRVNEYVQASRALEKAVELRPGEALFKDELASNLSTLALYLAENNQASEAGNFALRAKQLSDEVTEKHPNNVVYHKTRVRVLYSLAQLEPGHFDETLEAIEKASVLAPTDAKILYNKALLLDQVNRTQEAIQVLEKVIDLKPDYRDAYYLVATYNSQIAKGEKDRAKANKYNAKAREYLEYSLKNVQPVDKQSKDLLESLK